MYSVGGCIAGSGDTVLDSREFTKLRPDRAITGDVLRRERPRGRSAGPMGETFFTLFVGAEYTSLFLVQAKHYRSEMGKSLLRSAFGLRGGMVLLGGLGSILLDVRPWRHSR